ncbi:hypothetical protein [Mucilaginibacter lappiensis]|uniref:hypothetical protein n=1 Tax=Mucilaginibacter lappiensis TaxID=354630 RepID=UPI003D1BE326
MKTLSFIIAFNRSSIVYVTLAYNAPTADSTAYRYYPLKPAEAFRPFTTGNDAATSAGYPNNYMAI